MRFRLLVEGSDDYHLTSHLLLEHGVALKVSKEILDCKGIEPLLRDEIRLHLSGGYTSVGIVVDADLDVQSRWDSVRNRLVQEGYEVPLTPQPEGLIITTRQPTVGVWIMPDNRLPGTLEDFAKQLVPDGDDLWPLVERSVAAIPPASRRFAEADVRKAEIHTYLAWQKDPGTPMGLAITRKYFQTKTELALTFVEWIKRLRTP